MPRNDVIVKQRFILPHGAAKSCCTCLLIHKYAQVQKCHLLVIQSDIETFSKRRDYRLITPHHQAMPTLKQLFLQNHPPSYSSWLNSRPT